MKMGQAATQLLSAARDGNIAIVKNLLAEHSVDVNATDKNNATSLYWASQNGHHDIVLALLGEHAEVNKARSDNGWSPLMVASKKGHLGIVKTFIETGVDVNQANQDGLSPLMLASSNGHLDVLKTLIEAGANVCCQKQNGITPLFWASQEGHHAVVQTLLGAGAGVDVNVARSTDNTTPLFVACDRGHHGIVQMLLEAGANEKINLARSDGWSPLMVACYKVRPDILKSLIEAGANVNQTNKDGKTALDMAVEKRNNGIVEVLKTHQCQVISTLRQQLHQLNDVKQHKEQAEQQIKDLKQDKEQLEQQLKDIMQLKEQSEQKLHPMKQHKENTDQEILDIKQQHALELYGREQQFHKELLDLRQQKEQAEQQFRDMRQQKEQIEVQFREAKQQKDLSEQGLRLSRQMAEPLCNTQNILIPTEYLRPSWKIKRDEIHIIQEKPLGVGAWGEVKLAMFRGMKVAAKFMHEAIISSHTAQLFIREMDIAACVRHPNLLLFIGASLDNNKPVIITELMPDSLRSIVHNLSQDNVLSIGTDVAYGLNYLHLMKPDPIIHRDVSSANVLVEQIGSASSLRAKLSDYGSANYVSRVTTVGPGNSSYAAPESFTPAMQSPKMDVYSYGILLLEMATQQFPDPEIKMVQLNTLPWLSMAVTIRRCICEDRDKRPNMADVLLDLKQFNK